MKTPLIYFLAMFSLQLEAHTFAQSSTNLCPQQLIVAIECSDTNKDFQLLKHLGKYTQPKMELNKEQTQMVCSYGTTEWVSRYKFSDSLGERIATVSSLEELSSVANVIRSKGFKLDHFTDKSSPFTMVTYKQNARSYTPDQMFLFSGLESTYGKDNFTVAAADKNVVSTIVINERYLKSQNAAADTFVTGSNCLVMIK